MSDRMLDPMDLDSFHESGLLSTFCKSTHESRLLMCDAFLTSTSEYFFQRSPRIFNTVLEFYAQPVSDFGERTLHCPPDVCQMRFLQELSFWRLSPSLLAQCCQKTVANGGEAIKRSGSQRNSRRRKSQRRTKEEGSISPIMNNYIKDHPLELLHDNDVEDISDPLDCYPNQSPLDETAKFKLKRNSAIEIHGLRRRCVDPLFRGLKLASLRWRIWQTTEDPASSQLARVWACLSILFVLMSVSALIMSSLPEFQEPVPNQKIQISNSSLGEPRPKIEMRAHHSLEVVETVCIVWFTIELVLRFAVCPTKMSFVKTFLNIIDFLAIIPFFLELTLDIFGMSSEKMEDIQGAMLVIRILRVLRVTRVFKLARYSEGLQNFGKVLHKSVSELGMLFLFLTTAVIFFGTIMYFLEKDLEGTHFPTIPDACWWCVITMTTVGYGDVVPISASGKIIASIASISGVLVLAFPITTIVDKFAQMDPPPDDEFGTGTPLPKPSVIRIGGGSKFNIRRSFTPRAGVA